MKRFRFSLQALLTLRQREEHQALENYAAALLARRKAAEALAHIEDEMANAARTVREQLERGAPAADLEHLQLHYSALETRQKSATKALRNAELNIRPALDAMIEARRQREVVENCQEKQRQRHEREGIRAEHRLLDELALRRNSAALDWRSQA